MEYKSENGGLIKSGCHMKSLMELYNEELGRLIKMLNSKKVMRQESSSRNKGGVQLFLYVKIADNFVHIISASVISCMRNSHTTLTLI